MIKNILLKINLFLKLRMRILLFLMNIIIVILIVYCSVILGYNVKKVYANDKHDNDNKNTLFNFVNM